MFSVYCQNNCRDFVVFFEFMNSFFFWYVLRDVRQVNQIVDIVFQIDEDIKVSDRFDFISYFVVFSLCFSE